LRRKKMSVEKRNLENALGCEVSKSDTDGEYYRARDLKWVCEPTDEDPGVTEAIPGAVPARTLILEQ
jgi:hypothetical protein